MYKIDFKKPQHIHFIGIGGISMSGLAQVLLSKGFTVSGSDNLKSALTEELSKAGAEIYIGQRASNISENIDFEPFSFKLKNASAFIKEFEKATELWKNKNQTKKKGNRSENNCTTAILFSKKTPDSNNESGAISMLFFFS